MSSNKISRFALRWGIALLAVGLLSGVGPASSQHGSAGLAPSWSLVCAAYAQDNGAGAPAQSPGSVPAQGTGADNNAPAAGDTTGNSSVMGLNTAGIPIGANDVLHVDVVGQADLTNDYMVDGNGNITMPYVGKVHVAGMQTDQAAQAITKQLNTIYNNVTVTVTRRSVGGISVTLTGALDKQGGVITRRDSRLNDVIQQAITASDADLAHIKITRGLPGTPQTTITVDYASFLSSGNTDGNPFLHDGDIIYVPHKSPVTVSVSITGDVGSPGRYDMPQGSTFYDLISRSGGLKPQADRTAIYIQPIASLSHTSVNYDKASATPQDPNVDPILKDGDKVVVPELATAPKYTITGGVMSPGQKDLVGNVTLEDAIGQAGGLQDRAKAAQATVTRRTPNGAEVIKVDAADPKVAGNFLVQPDDNITIPPGHPKQQINPFEIIGLLISIYAVTPHH